MPDTKWSIFENGMPGLHLTINPQKPLPPEARLNRQFVDHGLTLTDKERESILNGRDKGIETVTGMMDKSMPGFSPDARRKIATHIVDALLDKSVAAQLSREAPTIQDTLQMRDDALRAVFQRAVPPGGKRAPVLTLLDQTPVGVSLTVHF